MTRQPLMRNTLTVHVHRDLDSNPGHTSRVRIVSPNGQRLDVGLDGDALTLTGPQQDSNPTLATRGSLSVVMHRDLDSVPIRTSRVQIQSPNGQTLNVYTQPNGSMTMVETGPTADHPDRAAAEHREHCTANTCCLDAVDTPPGIDTEAFNDAYDAGRVTGHFEGVAEVENRMATAAARLSDPAAYKVARMAGSVHPCEVDDCNLSQEEHHRLAYGLLAEIRELKRRIQEFEHGTGREPSDPAHGDEN